MGWTLLWPWPTVCKDLKEVWKGIKDCVSSAVKLDLSGAIDGFLKVSRASTACSARSTAGSSSLRC